MGGLILFALIGAELQMGALYWCIYGAIVTFCIVKAIIEVVTEDG